MAVIPPAGSPLGFFVPSPGAQDPFTPLLADLIDIQTGEYTSLATGDNAIDAQVKIAVRTIRNSGPAVENVGQRFADIRKLTESVAAELERETRIALGELVKRRDIQISKLTVTVTRSDASAEVFIEYRNMRTRSRANRERQLRFSPATYKAA